MYTASGLTLNLTRLAERQWCLAASVDACRAPAEEELGGRRREHKPNVQIASRPSNPEPTSRLCVTSTPLLASRSWPWPSRDDVFRARRRGDVREVRQHDHRPRRDRSASAPYNDPLARSKIRPDEVGVINCQSWRRRS
jgi:hypothetical protein